MTEMDLNQARINVIRIKMWLRKRKSPDSTLRSDADDGEWITTENNHRVHLNENGVPDKGNPHVLEAMNGGQKKGVVNGKDISKTYNGEPNIKAVVHAQGFDGPPNVVSDEEFDAAVKASGFVAQRVYTATSQEILDEYRESLYEGEWYIECSEGESRYGQGMYTVSNDEGQITPAMEKSIRIYTARYLDEQGDDEQFYYVETMTLAPDAKIAEHSELAKEWKDHFSAWEDEDEYEAAQEHVRAEFDREMTEKYGKAYTEYLAWKETPESYVHYGLNAKGSETEQWNRIKAKEETWLAKFGKDRDIIQSPKKELRARFEKYEGEVFKDARELHKKFGDINAYATACGYDAVKVGGIRKGAPDRYTMVLNRTKLIIRDGRNRKDERGDDAGGKGRIVFRPGKNGVIDAVRDGKVIGHVRTHDGQVDMPDKK